MKSLPRHRVITTLTLVVICTVAATIATPDGVYAQTANDQNNQERAIGLAHSAPGIAECLAQARADGQGVNPEARGSQDGNGEFTNWTVAFFSDQLDLGGNRIVLAVVRIEGWEIVSSECR